MKHILLAAVFVFSGAVFAKSNCDCPTCNTVECRDNQPNSNRNKNSAKNDSQAKVDKKGAKKTTVRGQ